MECWTCLSNAGVKRISPGPTIYEGKYWLLEHAYPITRKGWFVIVLKRHLEALHELSSEEFIEGMEIIQKLVRIQNLKLHSEKEYLSCYAEGDHYHHVHFHVFAKPHDLQKEYLGTKSFKLLRGSEEEIITPEEINEYCQLLRKYWIELCLFLQPNPRLKLTTKAPSANLRNAVCCFRLK